MDKEVRRIIYSFIPGGIFVSLMWLVKFVEWRWGIIFVEYGVLPRTMHGLIGIITSPLIHGDIQHLVSNSIPFLVLSAGMIYFYRSLAYKVFGWVYLLGGFWLWLGGRESYHIGSSGVVYGLTTFLFLSGVLRRDTRLMALSLLVVFLYGGMVWGIFPLFREISWEAHLYGSLAGILMALVYRKEGPQRKVFEWEGEDKDEGEDDDDDNAYWKIPRPTDISHEPEQKPEVKIHYIYRKKNPDTGKTDSPDDEKN